MRDLLVFFFFQAEDGIRDADVTGVQTCALPIAAPTRCSAMTARRSSTGASRRAGTSSSTPRGLTSAGRKTCTWASTITMTSSGAGVGDLLGDLAGALSDGVELGLARNGWHQVRAETDRDRACLQPRAHLVVADPSGGHEQHVAERAEHCAQVAQPQRPGREQLDQPRPGIGRGRHVGGGLRAGNRLETRVNAGANEVRIRVGADAEPSTGLLAPRDLLSGPDRAGTEQRISGELVDHAPQRGGCAWVIEGDFHDRQAGVQQELAKRHCVGVLAQPQDGDGSCSPDTRDDLGLGHEAVTHRRILHVWLRPSRSAARTCHASPTTVCWKAQAQALASSAAASPLSLSQAAMKAARAASPAPNASTTWAWWPLLVRISSLVNAVALTVT